MPTVDPLFARSQLAIEESQALLRRSRVLKGERDHMREQLRVSVLELPCSAQKAKRSVTTGSNAGSVGNLFQVAFLPSRDLPALQTLVNNSEPAQAGKQAFASARQASNCAFISSTCVSSAANEASGVVSTALPSWSREPTAIPRYALGGSRP
jgi:hypothetical protein